MCKLLYKTIIIFAIVGLILPIFSFAQIDTGKIKEEAPGILEGWWNSIRTFFVKAKDVFWGALIKAWQGAISLWQKMWLWIKTCGNLILVQSLICF